MAEKKKHTTLIAILLIFLLVVCFASLFLGSEIISPETVIDALLGDAEAKYVFIVQEIRLPRILTALLAGAALSTAGLQMQTYFRNGLAGPYILGISAGSGLGVALLVMSGTIFGFDLIENGISTTMAAIFGALGVLLIILLLSKKIGSGILLLIVGIMLGSFISASINVLEYFTDAESMRKYVLWTMGSTSETSLQDVFIIAVFVAIGLIVSVFSIRTLNALLLGEDYARSLGISIGKTRTLIILSTGLLAGVITAYCGPVAFVGLAVPHLVRMMVFTANHKIVLPLVVIMGAIIMVLCDMIAEMPGMDIRLPINAVTSLVGAPVVIYVIIKNRTLTNA